MSYPNLPKNRLLIKLSDDKLLDLTEEFKMVLIDDYTLEPPEPKTYMIEIPGGNGKLDLTESLLGDTVYNNRKQEFTFNLIDVENFEKMKTKISNLLHGKEFDYQLTMDPGYTYHGRFEITDYSHVMYPSGKVGIFKISIDAEPFKKKATESVSVDAAGGTIVKLKSGRMPVRPTIETNGFLKVIYKNKLTILGDGKWTLNDILFREGTNSIYLNSFEMHKYKWGDLITNKITWKRFAEKPLFEWYKQKGNSKYALWCDLEDKKYSDLENKKWSELVYEDTIPKDVKNVTVKYEWRDL